MVGLSSTLLGVLRGTPALPALTGQMLKQLHLTVFSAYRNSMGRMLSSGLSRSFRIRRGSELGPNSSSSSSRSRTNSRWSPTMRLAALKSISSFVNSILRGKRFVEIKKITSITCACCRGVVDNLFSRCFFLYIFLLDLHTRFAVQA
jgi:hypothetical protein